MDKHRRETKSVSSLGTRPFAVRRKLRVWALAYIQVVPRMECCPDQYNTMLTHLINQ